MFSEWVATWRRNGLGGHAGLLSFHVFSYPAKLGSLWLSGHRVMKSRSRAVCMRGGP
jgi:hypothetical protein